MQQPVLVVSRSFIRGRSETNDLQKEHGSLVGYFPQNKGERLVYICWPFTCSATRKVRTGIREKYNIGGDIDTDKQMWGLPFILAFSQVEKRNRTTQGVFSLPAWILSWMWGNARMKVRPKPAQGVCALLAATSFVGYHNTANVCIALCTMLHWSLDPGTLILLSILSIPQGHPSSP
eukprot:1158256-Pelagomonas_calceolata.AAC.6